MLGDMDCGYETEFGPIVKSSSESLPMFVEAKSDKGTIVIGELEFAIWHKIQSEIAWMKNIGKK